MTSSITILNEGADFWYYEIEANVIPANTKDKNTFESWTDWQEKSIPIEMHEDRKKKGEYENGLAVMTGRIYKGKNEGKYLIGIDCDNKKAIEEICTRNGKQITLEELAQWTIIEQHKDNPNKAHIYILSTKPFKNKDRDPNNAKAESMNEIPAIEVKCEKRIMFCAPSLHQDGYPYEILGTRGPALYNAFENHLDNIFRKYDINYLQEQQQKQISCSNENNNNNYNSSPLPEELKKLINWLVIPPNFEFKIYQGTRHPTMLSFANSLLFKYKYNDKISKNELKDFFIQVNNKVCSPPLTENELINNIWDSALKYSEKEQKEKIQIINNDKDDEENYNKPILIPLEIGEELEKQGIIKNFVKDNQQNNLVLEFNENKYTAANKIRIPITGPKKWLEFRKSFRKILLEYEIKEEHIKLIIKALDSNYDIIIDETRDAGDNLALATIADTLVKLAEEQSIFFKDEFNTPYALVKVNDHFEVMSIKSKNFESYLSKLFYDYNNKKTANSQAINNAKITLGAKAKFDGKTIPLYLRIAWANLETKEAIYYDLSDETRRCIKITKGNGWKIVENQLEVLFKRYGHQAPQIEPSYEYDYKILDNFIDSLNIKNEKHKLLIKVWIISLLVPDISRVILLPYGPPGSAKSTLLKKIQLLIDPTQLDLLSINDSKTEYIQQISHHYLCFFDNLSHVPRWLPDEACRTATGAASSKRELYTDDEDIPYKYKRPQSYAGINVIFTQEDVLDRSIKIELDRIEQEDNIPDSKIEEDLKQQIPQLLGYILDVLAKALELKDFVELKRLPRMADFAVWGEAIARALGYKPLEFLNTYFENIDQQHLEIVESDPFAETLSRFIDYDMTSWISSPKILINYLNEYADKNNIDSSKFPKAVQTISYRLNRIKPILLESLGIEVIIERITKGKGTSKSKLNTSLIKIRKRSPAPPTPPACENDEGSEGINAGDLLKDAGGEISNTSKTSPALNTQNHAQISNDIITAGDAGDAGGLFRNLSQPPSSPTPTPSPSPSQFVCHYCSYQGKSENEVLVHSVNAHPGKPALPDESITRLEKGGIKRK